MDSSNSNSMESPSRKRVRWVFLGTAWSMEGNDEAEAEGGRGGALMADKRPKKGDDVYVKNPQRFIPNCTCIVGYVTATHKGGRWLTIDASVGRMGGGYDAPVTMRTEECGIRLGTRISQISTQPGTPGYSEWLRISRSWGHP